MPVSHRERRTAVILTAIPCEYEAVRAKLRDIKEDVHPQGSIYDVGCFDAADGAVWTIAISEVGAGNETAAFALERAAERFGATHALFVGVAGGLKDVALGDVVAATKIYGYEWGKAQKRFLPRPEVGQSSHDLIERAKAVARGSSGTSSQSGKQDLGYSALVGAIAAGSKVVASRRSATAKFLQRNYGDAAAVEMEGKGFLTAAHARPNMRVLVVRGISDLLDRKKQTDDEGWQTTAARNAADFAFQVLANLYPTRSKGAAKRPGSGRPRASSSGGLDHHGDAPRVQIGRALSAKKRKQRDQDQLRSALETLDTEWLDFYLRELRSERIPWDTDEHYLLFTGTVGATSFQLFDRTVDRLMREFASAWEAVYELAGRYGDAVSNAQHVRFRPNNPANQDAIRQQLQDLVTTMLRSLRSLVGTLHDSYPELDISETDAIAKKTFAAL